MFILGLCPRINFSSFWFFSALRRKLLGVLRIATVFLLFLLLFLSLPFPWRAFSVIYPSLIDLSRQFVDYAGRYLSACPIQRLP